MATHDHGHHYTTLKSMLFSAELRLSESSLVTEWHDTAKSGKLKVILCRVYAWYILGYKLYPLVSASRTLLRTCIRRHVDECKLLVRDTCIRLHVGLSGVNAALRRYTEQASATLLITVADRTIQYNARTMAIANRTCVNFCNQPKAQFGYLRRV